MTTKRRKFSLEFKREAAQLVLDQSYSVSQACESLGIGATALRRWVKQIKISKISIKKGVHQN